MNRRQFLQATASTAVLLTGCLSLPAADDEDPAVVVEEVLIDNTIEEAQTLELELEYDGEILHAATHEIDAAEGSLTGGMEVDVDLPTEPGEFVVRTAIGETTRESNIADKHGNGCITVQVWVEPDEVPSILTRHDGTECLE